ncbi:beta-galactosidase domain 4-containing protein [Cellulosimicrobium sp. CUA-896]|uniref:beta-galactosidase domain 4-containing protein n=1 Tax=Cellulosimicrobium sp. CUA-896 TaxID=1517881 RepID=UPI003519D35E
MNGVLFPDRTWKPGAYEVRKQYQDLKFSQTDEQRAEHQVTMTNVNRFKNANHYDIVWSLQQDGTTVQTGTLSDAEADLAPPTGDVAGGSTKVLTIPYGLDDPAPGAEYQLLVEYRLAADTPYADAGYVQGGGQFALDAHGVDQLVDVAGLDASRTETTDDAVTVTGTTPEGSPFTVAVDRATGLLDTYQVDGVDLVSKAPVGSFFRAETDQNGAVRGNAHNLRTPEAYQGWLNQGEDPRDVSVDVLGGDGTTTKIVVNATLENGSAYATTYTVYANGTVVVGARLVPSAEAPDQLGEFGMMMQLPGRFENVEWFGRGPSETYWDRKEGNDVGVWSGTVTDQFVAYPRIQENGNKTDVRWMALTDDDGTGLLASMTYGEGYAGDPLEAVALHYTPEALSSYNSQDRYPHEVERTDDVVLRVLEHQKGVGNLDWGSEPPSAVIRKTDADLLDYTYTLTPLEAGSDPMALSKAIYPAPTYALLDSVTVDGEPLEGFTPETFDYDHVLPDYYPESLLPVVEATAPEGTTVTIDQPTEVPGTAVLHVTSGSSSVDYTVHLERAPEPEPVVSVTDLVEVPTTISASGAFTGGQPGVGDLLYAYSGYSRIFENVSGTGAGLETASGTYAKGFQGNAEQIVDVDVSDLAVRSFSAVAGIDPSKWSGSGATRSTVVFEVWGHRDVGALDAAYYAPMAPGSAGTGTIVTDGWTKLAASPVISGKNDFAFDEVPLTYEADGATGRYQALRLVMNANGDNGHDQGVWGDPRVAVDLPQDPQLHAIEVDGAPLPGFDPGTDAYTLVLGSGADVPTVTVDHDTGLYVQVRQAAQVPGTATVRVGTETYTIDLRRAEVPEGQQAYLSDLVTAPTTISPDGEDQAAVLDGNLLYAYSASGAVYVDRSEGVEGDTALRLREAGEDGDVVTYDHGFAGRAQQVLDVDVSHRDALRFTADVGIDHTVRPDGAAVRFAVWGARDAASLTNGYYASADPAAGELPAEGWDELGTSPVLASADVADDLGAQTGLHRFDLDLTWTDEDGERHAYEALRLEMLPVEGATGPAQGVWGDPQVTFVGDEVDEPVDMIRLTSDVDGTTASVGYLLSTEPTGEKIRSIAVAYDDANRMLGYREVTFDTEDGNQDGDLPITLPEGTTPASLSYLLVRDGTLAPVAGAWTKDLAAGEDSFSHAALRDVVPASGPTVEVRLDAATQDVTVQGAGFSPGAVLVLEGLVDGVDGLDHVAFVAADGRGVLDYTYRSAATSLDEVTVRVGGQGFEGVVERPEEPAGVQVSAVAEVRCLAGRPYLAVRVVNDDDVPVDVEVATPYGTRSFAAVAPGKNAYHAFAVRGAEPQADAATVTARPSDGDGGETVVVPEHALPACG